MFLYRFIICLSLSCFFCIQGVFSYTWNSLTIEQIQTNIQELHQTNITLDAQLQELQNSERIRWFFKNNLSEVELEELSIIIKTYIEERKNHHIDEQDKTILLKKNLYKDMIPYVELWQMESYLNYIQDDANIIKRQGQLSKELSKNQELLENKVDFIETKITEHKKTFSATLRDSIDQKIDQKISLLREGSKFSTLSVESKISVLEKTIRKIKIRISNVEQMSDRTDILETRLELFYIILEKIESFKNEIQ